MDTDLPQTEFHVGQLVGRGAFAVVHLCFRPARPADVFATKFIHRRGARRLGPGAIEKEIALHRHCSAHPNIVAFLDTACTDHWYWISMEAALGGDLFDKIEPDVGVPDDIAQLYFQQLASAVEYMHSRGVAHRDIKPENILLDAGGNLKLSDFGLATLYVHKGTRRPCRAVCGSMPYVAPEIVAGEAYYADHADLWSCGILLFVLLCGCTPWDAPQLDDPDFCEYVARGSKPSGDPWDRISPEALSLVRGLVKLDPARRFAFSSVRKHPWFNRPNPLISGDGSCADPVLLAERLITQMHIPLPDRLAASQPAAPGRAADARVSASQPVAAAPDAGRARLAFTQASFGDAPDLALLQFSQTRALPDTLTQRARHFNDICPSSHLTRFYATTTMGPLVSLLTAALHRLGIAVPAADDLFTVADRQRIRLRALDRRKCTLQGSVVCQTLDDGLVEVDFQKIRGDPLEWRLLFRKVAVLCHEVVYTDA
ncbi:kinase-like domain-containing protein [Dipodascopsis tothii]|uniref:kinase-like domain-containing protein n=1 Tax=Dipodascopsis tothii TaxID=44089 RepID=UPI0034CF9914